MDIKDLTGETVIHRLFGKGEIKEAGDGYLKIDFLEYNRKSEFVYPSCFDVYLKLEKKEIQESVIKDLEDWKEENDEPRKERLKRRYEKRQQGIRARQLAVEERNRRTARRIWERRSG